jgi:aminoglycoside 3-N-acetyltransferase
MCHNQIPEFHHTFRHESRDSVEAAQHGTGTPCAAWPAVKRMKQTVTRATISTALAGAGISKGDKILLHSSLSSLGNVEGGAEAVAEGVLDAIGPKGTLMVPTFNYWAVELFDRATTPGLTGAITEAVRRREGATRSLHPTHSVSAIGDRAAEFVANHENIGALRVGSPVDKLAKAGGYTLLLGVRHDANSTIHVGEAYAKPWYLGFPFKPDEPTEAQILVDGSRKRVELKGLQSGCSLAFNSIELPLRKYHEIVDFKIGVTLCQLISMQATIDRTAEMICEREDILLCSWAACFYCSNARRHRKKN